MTAAQLTTLQASVWSDDVNAQTISYTLVLADAGKQITMTSATAVTLTVPLNSSVAFPVGVRIHVINLGAGVLTVAGAGGVTVSHASNDLSMQQYGVMTLYKTGTDAWAVEYAYDAEDDQPILANLIFS